MHTAALTRLRLGFLLLAAALLLPLFVLLRSVQARLEAQRRLRHEIVAERIFDEMERELTELVAREGERPSSAYDATSTRVETWAPFVVGYFTREEDHLRVIAREQLGAERAARVEQALQATNPRQPGGAPAPSLDEAPATPSLRVPEQQPKQVLEPLGLPLKKSRTAKEAAPAEQQAAKKDEAKLEQDKATTTPAASEGAPAAAAPVRSDSESVLRQLNRGAEQRETGKLKSKPGPRAKSGSEAAPDPLMGLE